MSLLKPDAGVEPRRSGVHLDELLVGKHTPVNDVMCVAPDRHRLMHRSGWTWRAPKDLVHLYEFLRWRKPLPRKGRTRVSSVNIWAAVSWWIPSHRRCKGECTLVAVQIVDLLKVLGIGWDPPGNPPALYRPTHDRVRHACV